MAKVFIKDIAHSGQLFTQQMKTKQYTNINFILSVLTDEKCLQIPFTEWLASPQTWLVTFPFQMYYFENHCIRLNMKEHLP